MQMHQKRYTFAMSRDRETLSSGQVRAWARLLRASQAVLGAVEAELKAKGFPPLSWYDALLELRRAGAKGLRPYELQGVMLLAQYNLSRLTERLARAGHIERIACEDDGRGHILRLTPQGGRLLKKMWPAYQAAIARHFADKLGGKDADALARILGKLA